MLLHGQVSEFLAAHLDYVVSVGGVQGGQCVITPYMQTKEISCLA